MYVMIDNYDSFVHNLAVYMEELGQEIQLVRNDKVDLDDLRRLYRHRKLDGILISPGPKSPKDCGQSLEILREMAGLVPILGICLGHQIIGYAWNARIAKGPRPMHGKVTPIRHQPKTIVSGTPRPISGDPLPLFVVCQAESARLPGNRRHLPGWGDHGSQSPISPRIRSTIPPRSRPDRARP